MYFPSLDFPGGGLLLPVCLWVELASLGLGFPSSTFCRAGYIYCLYLILALNVFFCFIYDD